MVKHTESEVHDICAYYEVAYARANPGISISVRATKPGWYQLDQVGGITGARRSYRLSQIEGMTVRLKIRIATADERTINPEAYVVVAKPAKETGKDDFFLTDANTWVSSMQYAEAKRFIRKSDADLIAMGKNYGFPHRYVVVQPA